jgi:lipopolysaccharide heptosyltransferase II
MGIAQVRMAGSSGILSYYSETYSSFTARADCCAEVKRNSSGCEGQGGRILIVGVNWVGDVLFMTPFIRALREARPKSHIACLLHPRCAEMLEGNPRLDELIIYDEELAHKGFLAKMGLVLSLKRKCFDEAFILHRSFTKALLTMLAGIGKRTGYPTKKRAWVLTDAVEEPLGEIHKVEYFMNILKAAGIESKDHSYEFFVRDGDRDYITGLLKRNGIQEKDLLAVICPGGNWEPKRWPKERYAALGNGLSEKLGAVIVIAGAKKDVVLAEAIAGMMKKPPVITCGQTTLKELGALMERASLVIANDTGPMHIASAMGANLIALFGPTSPHITGPYGRGPSRVIFKNDECDVPCYDVTCADNRCMGAITVEDVMKQAQALLSSRVSKP